MSEITNILTETVERLFRDLMKDGMPDTSKPEVFHRLWDPVEALDITNLLLDEEVAGFAASWVDAFQVFKRLGSHALPLPVGETIIAKYCLRQADMEIPDGPISVGITDDYHIRDGIDAEYSTIDVTVNELPWGHLAPHILLLCQTDNSSTGSRSRLVLLDAASGSSCTKLENIASEPRIGMEFKGAPVVAINRPERAAPALLPMLALLRTAQMSGALETALGVCVNHVRERQQFGRPISKFQVIQHQISILAEHAAAVSCAAQSASSALDVSDANFEICAAKIRANRAVGESTSIAHQVHGAIGFTKEHSLHYYTQRLWAWRSEYGNDRFWARTLGKLMLDEDALTPWQQLTMHADKRATQ